MLRFLLAVFIGFTLNTSALSASTDKEEANWQVLNNCTLVSHDSINDGDSFLIAHKGEEFIFRLYFVDTLETRNTYIDRVRDQARYFAIPEKDVIQSGKAATTFTENFLDDSFTVITRWKDARGSGGTPRHFALVVKDDTYLSAKLVENGLARIYGMPTQQPWPGGATPRTYLNHLKSIERKARFANRGIWASASASAQATELARLNTGTDITGDEVDLQPTSDGGASSRFLGQGGLIDLNTASQQKLESLPGIGPSLAGKIIAARPIQTIDSLANISGISQATIHRFRSRVTAEPRRSSANTIRFYLADLDSYLDTEITVQVASVKELEIDAPESFHAVHLQTIGETQPDNGITTFIPDEFYDSFILYYANSGREFKALLYLYEGAPVLVYQRK